MEMGSKMIVGNWKMYKTVAEALAFVDALLPKVSSFQNPLFIAVPFTALWPLHEKCGGSPLKIGAQNMCAADEGAFTGEIAGRMLKEAGASFVLLGHSERRRLFNETDQVIRLKLEKALEVDLLPILCVGESLEEREGGKSEEILKKQIEALFKDLKWKGEDLVIAYEPVWAIGTGKTATPEIIERMHHLIEKEVEAFSDLPKPKILYGGSAKKENAKSLLDLNGVDGLLIGGASLDLESFLSIAENGERTG